MDNFLLIKHYQFCCFFSKVALTIVDSVWIVIAASIVVWSSVVSVVVSVSWSAAVSAAESGPASRCPRDKDHQNDEDSDERVFILSHFRGLSQQVAWTSIEMEYGYSKKEYQLSKGWIIDSSFTMSKAKEKKAYLVV